MKGYIRERGSKWSYTVDIGIDPITGKRKQKTKSGFVSEKEAKKALKEYIQRFEKGRLGLSFGDYADRWLHEHTQGLKITSFRNYSITLQPMKAWFKDYLLKEITSSLYQNALNDLAKKYKISSLKSIHARTKQLFKRALELELIHKNPTEFAKLPREMKTVEQLEQEEIQHKYLEKEELHLFLEAAKRQGLKQDYPLFLLLAYTGMRIGELGALKWSDIDFKNGTISVTKTLFIPQKIEGYKYQLLPPKSKKSKRMIDIDPVLIIELQKHQSRQKKDRMRFRGSYHNQDFIFTNPNYPGFPIHSGLYTYRMNVLLKLAAIGKKLSPHSLRHTHASLLAEAGLDLTDIMERLGHESMETTLKIYLHVTQNKKVETMELFDKLMNSKRT